jgi:hypothetical protein
VGVFQHRRAGIAQRAPGLVQEHVVQRRLGHRSGPDPDAAVGMARVVSVTDRRMLPPEILAARTDGPLARSRCSTGKLSRGRLGAMAIVSPEYRCFSSLGVPPAITRPWSMIASRSLSWSASSR